MAVKRWRLAVCVSAVYACGAVGGAAQTQYTNDGAMTGIEEECRWHANRARFDPVKEKARLALSSSVPTGPIPPLAPHAKLITAARNHSEDMALTGIFQHNTPVGSTHYPAGFEFWQRITNETYFYSSCGENIAAGYSSGRDAHDAWFLSETGHRENLLSSAFREVGVGYAYRPSSPWRYYTEDLATALGSAEHWFTDTLFFDTGTNGYDASEGIVGVDIYLRTAAGLHGWYDRSSDSGSFAIPISSIPDGSNVHVILVNRSGSATNVTIPLNYDTLLRVALSNGESYVYGAFEQPTSVRNMGFRDVVPVGNRIVASTQAVDGVRVTATTLPGGTYALEWRESLTAGNWAGAVTSTAAAVTTTFLDAGGPGRPAPGVATSRFYRVVLLRNL